MRVIYFSFSLSPSTCLILSKTRVLSKSKQSRWATEKKMKNLKKLPLSAAILIALTTQAQEKLANVVVTASRYQQAIEDIIPSVSVINKEDIETLQANNILDILSLQQGIDVARTGGTGSSTSIFMRGTNSNHTLVLINGMRAGSSFTGSFAWEHIPVAQIEQIEIVRGTRVSYYGADAIGGVINIITKQQDNLTSSYTGGSFDTQNFNFAYGNSSELSRYTISLNSLKTDGFSATNANNAFAFNPDDDGYENQSININTQNDFATGSLTFNLMESHGDTDFDTGNSDSKERIARLSWNNLIANNWHSEFAIGNNYNELSTKVFSSNFNSQRYSVDWLLNKQIDYKHYSYGITYRNEKAEFLNPNAIEVSFSDSRNNLAAFANLQSTFNKTILAASIRYDDNSVYGGDFSADFDWAYHITDNSRVNFSVGSAFHAPNINELFSPNFQGLVTSPITGESVFAFAFEGNPDLKPEESLNYELGYKTNYSENSNLSFNAFYYKIDNLIEFQGFTFKPVNVNKATIKGLEADYTYQQNGLKFNINATVQSAKNDTTSSKLLRRPDNKLNISLDKNYNAFSVGSSVRYASKSPDFGVTLDAYSVLDLRAAYQINHNWNIALKLENVLDEDYQIVNGYNTPKSSAYFTIRWQN